VLTPAAPRSGAGRNEKSQPRKRQTKKAIKVQDQGIQGSRQTGTAEELQPSTIVRQKLDTPRPAAHPHERASPQEVGSSPRCCHRRVQAGHRRRRRMIV